MTVATVAVTTVTVRVRILLTKKDESRGEIDSRKYARGQIGKEVVSSGGWGLGGVRGFDKQASRHSPIPGLWHALVTSCNDAGPDLVAHVEQRSHGRLGICAVLLLQDVQDILHEDICWPEVLHHIIEGCHLAVSASVTSQQPAKPSVRACCLQARSDLARE